MNLQQLIDKGEELRTEPYDSPDVDMWQNDVKAAVAPFGEETGKVLHRTMWFGEMVMSPQHGQQMHNEMITKVQKLLQNLQRRDSENTRAQSDLINQKKQEVQASLKAKFGNATFHGPVTFGDNSPANTVQVGELMLAIINQAEEELPDGPEKEKILTNLKSALANPTFAAIAGDSLPEILKKLFGS